MNKKRTSQVPTVPLFSNGSLSRMQSFLISLPRLSHPKEDDVKVRIGSVCCYLGRDSWELFVKEFHLDFQINGILFVTEFSLDREMPLAV